MKTEDFPHVQAAFINAIREEGTKQEACDWLQRQWNESCFWEAKCKALMARLECDHAFQLVEGKMVRVDMELPEGADGIACRDATIHTLQEQLDARRKRDPLPSTTDNMDG